MHLLCGIFPCLSVLHATARISCLGGYVCGFSCFELGISLVRLRRVSLAFLARWQDSWIGCCCCALGWDGSGEAVLASLRRDEGYMYTFQMRRNDSGFSEML